MQQLTKVQITIGILAYFSIVWALYENLSQTSDILFDIAGIIVATLVVLLLLSFVILSILEWVKLFDLKTNAVLTLVTLTVFGISLLMITKP